MLAVVAPRMALKREQARQRLDFINTGYSYHGASTTKKSLQGFRDFSASPDDDITTNLPTLRNRCRSLFQGVPVATGALKTARTNVVGSGLKMNANVDPDVLGLTDEQADKLNTQLEREWALFADSKDCDIARTCNFNQLQRLAFLSALMSGDVFALLPIKKRPGVTYGLCVQLVEADRVCNPYDRPEIDNFRAGIELDEYGAPIRYHVAKYHPNSLMIGTLNTWTAVDAFGSKTGRRNVLHLMDLERPGQRRGVPFLAPVIESLKQLGRYTDAELMAAVVSGLFTAAITSDAPNFDLGELGSVDLGDDPDAVSEEGDDPGVALGNGTVIQLAPGEKLETVNPGRPNAQFDPFVTAILRQIGASLEIPMELLVKHFTASYSASRAALLEAWKLFKTQRTWLASDFCQPVYEEWLAEAVARGRIKAPGFFKDPLLRKAYCRAEWNGPAPGQIDPLKEVNAAVVRVNNCFSTRAKETAELTGGDFDANLRARIKEEKQMRDGELIPANSVLETVTDDISQQEDQGTEGETGKKPQEGGDTKSGT